MRLTALMVISMVALVVVLAVVLPSARSSKIEVDDYVVQIWQPETVSGEPEALLAFGIVVDDGKHNANYNAGYYGEEELKASLLQKYIAGELP